MRLRQRLTEGLEKEKQHWTSGKLAVIWFLGLYSFVFLVSILAEGSFTREFGLAGLTVVMIFPIILAGAAVITFSVVVRDWIKEKQRVALEMVESMTEGDRLGLNRQEGTRNTSFARQKSWKARLAKEWLIFLPLFLVTAVVLTLSFGEDYFEALFFDRVSDSVVAWLVTLAPYLLVQLIRSIIWAIRMLRATSD